LENLLSSCQLYPPAALLSDIPKDASGRTLYGVTGGLDMVAQTEIAGTVGNRNPEILAFIGYGSIHIYDVLLFMETVGGQNC
jgi:hypothetical protein